MVYNLRSKVIFRNNPSERSKNRFLYMTNFIANKMAIDLADDKIFDRLTTIEVFDASTRSPEMIKYNSIGLAFYDGRIHTSFFDGPGDNSVLAMEMAHNVMLKLLNVQPGGTFYDEFNNWIHYAANKPKPTIGDPAGVETYLPSKLQTWYGTLTDFLLGKWLKMRIMWYDMELIMRDGGTMNDHLRNGTAPTGIHEYWKVKDPLLVQMNAEGIIPGSMESMKEYEALKHMGTWDKPHYGNNHH